MISETKQKEYLYQELTNSCNAITVGEPDLIANLANICALIKESFNFFWVGFYMVKKDELILGPFQGPVACTRIQRGKGVCGTAWQTKKSILVPDVHQFEGHIACSSESQSEMVFPILKNGEVVMVLDIDSDKLNDFDQKDMDGFQAVCNVIESIL